MITYPIETAPRDGRALLLFSGDRCAVGIPKRFPRPLTAAGPNTTVSMPGDRWEIWRDSNVAPGHTWSMQPTHWAPLPAGFTAFFARGE